MGLNLPLHELPNLEETDATPVAEKTIVARLFAVGSAATWLIAEYDPEEKVAFGYTALF